MTGTRFFGDDPIDGTADSPDQLDRVAYAGHVATLIDRVRQQSESSVLSLIGPWGSGKSSVLALTQEALRTNAGPIQWILAEFNPWDYGDLESLLNGFFVSLRTALPKDRRWNESRKQLGTLAITVSPLGKLAALAGLDASGIIKSAGKLIAGDNSATATKKSAEKALRAAGQPILMVLDDLDRLTPDELLLVMKLVRLVGRLANVYYLLAYDEQTVREVLKRTELVGDDDARARDYLEKIVQVRLDMPALRETQADGLVGSALNEVLNQYSIELSPDATNRIQTAYREHLRHGLQTPRSINRFFGQLEAFYSVVLDEVDFVDFTLITWLRTMYPMVYSELQRHKADLTGTNVLGGIRQQSLSESRQEWWDRLVAAGVPKRDVDGMLAVLALMFVPVRSANENVNYGSTYIGDVGRRRGVGHVDYFDRYFTFGIPAEDIADSVVLAALRQLRDNVDGPELNLLSSRLTSDTERILRKLSAQRAAGNTPPAALVGLLADNYGSLPEDAVLFRPDPKWSTAFLTCQLLTDLDPADGPSVIRAVARGDAQLSLMAHAVDLLSEAETRDRGGLGRLVWLAEAQATLLQFLTARLDLAAQHPLDQLSDEMFRLIWVWHNIDAESMRAWLVERTTSGEWPILDVLARLVPVGSVSGGGPSRPALGDVSLGDIDELFGLDNVLIAVEADLENLEAPDLDWAVDPTLENRRRVVLQALRAERARRRLASAEGTETKNSIPPQVES